MTAAPCPCGSHSYVPSNQATGDQWRHCVHCSFRATEKDWNRRVPIPSESAYATLRGRPPRRPLGGAT